MADLEIQGVDQFVRVAKALRQVGDKELKRELRLAIKDAATPMTDEVRDQVAQYLPDRYAAVLAPALKTGQSWRTGGSTVGLVLTGYAKGKRSRRHVKAINRGVLRRPVYGNREAWVAQQVRPGFWDEPLANAKRLPTWQIRKALRDIARKLDRKY
jgi:hypothetical protein